jgi:hypothetical protein
MGRLVKTRDQIVSVLRGAPDAFAIQAASLGGMTNTMSPGSRGRHDGHAGFFSGDRGFGVNRWAGAFPYQSGPVQQYAQLPAPVLSPISARVGLGAMSSGQPGLPQSGMSTGDAAVAWISAYQHSGGMGT